MEIFLFSGVWKDTFKHESQPLEKAANIGLNPLFSTVFESIFRQSVKLVYISVFSVII